MTGPLARFSGASHDVLSRTASGSHPIRVRGRRACAKAWVAFLLVAPRRLSVLAPSTSASPMAGRGRPRSAPGFVISTSPSSHARTLRLAPSTLDALRSFRGVAEGRGLATRQTEQAQHHVPSGAVGVAAMRLHSRMTVIACHLLPFLTGLMRLRFNSVAMAE